MMAKKFNLAEFVKAESVSDSDTMEITMIPVTRIRMNPRNFYEPADVGDLVDSIAMNGLMDPIVVYKGSGILYTILSGHRRYAAITAIRGGKGHEHDFDEVPCIVRPAPADTAREDILLIQANSTGRIRTAKDMAEEARRLTAAFTQLKKEGADLPGRVRDMVADAMGVSKSKVARIQAIEHNLAVPGFQAAYKKGELSEAAAYEISQMDREAQYRLLDRAVDDGLDYAKLDIKGVQRLRRRVEAGESPKQDLRVEAERRGILIRDDDFSPLLAELVAEAIPESWQKGLSSCRSKAEALEHLHRFGFGHASSCGGKVDYSSDPQALTITSPICRRMKWAEVWELLALWRLRHPAEAPVPAPAPEKPKAEVKLKAGEWRRWPEDRPEEGRTVCVVELGTGGYYADVFVFRDGTFRELDDPESDWQQGIREGALWFPVPEVEL